MSDSEEVKIVNGEAYVLKMEGSGGGKGERKLKRVWTKVLKPTAKFIQKHRLISKGLKVAGVVSGNPSLATAGLALGQAGLGKKPRKASPWIAHVKAYAKANNCTYKEAMSRAKPSYKKGGGISLPGGALSLAGGGLGGSGLNLV